MIMKSLPMWHQPKRIMGAVVAGSMLLQTVTPAFAEVSQVPGVYVPPPDANVMFTLDDSGSMTSDAIPDFINDVTGLPNNSSSNALAHENYTPNTRFPGMWKLNSSYLTPLRYHSSNPIARYLRSTAGNPLYYDYKVTYAPWPNPANDTQTYANANIRAVNIHHSNPLNTGRTVDLTARLPDAVGADNEDNNFWPATYYIYHDIAQPLPPASPNHALNRGFTATFGSPARRVWTKVEIKPDVPTYARAVNPTTGLVEDSRTDCGTGTTTCTYAQEIQNFANWLQYYRSRMLMAKGGVAAAFAKQRTNLRVGFGSINSSGTVRLGVRPFSGTSRTNFYNELYGRAASGGTPLRQAMDQVGRYFQTTDVNNPWAFLPGTTTSPEYDCRRSFHVLSTDGFWNGNGASGNAANDNDNLAGTFTPYKPNGTTRYAFTNTVLDSSDPLTNRFTVSPFADAASSEGDDLSDVAAYYWRTDLRGSISNNVPPSRRDPAFWQHLTTFTVGLGISGSGAVRRVSDGSTVIPAAEAASGPFQTPDRLPAPWLTHASVRDALVANRISLNWPSVVNDARETGDDLVRAAMVGRGRYFSATNPTDLAAGLSSALAEALDQPLTLANLSASSSRVSANGRIYQAIFNPDRWYGRLYSFNQNTNGEFGDPGTERWEASHKMPPHNARNIFTWNSVSSSASTFTWSGLTATQRGHLNNDPSLLDYLRGDGSREVLNGGGYRDRTRYTPAYSTVPGGVLGDIIGGSPLRPPADGVNYQNLPPGTPGKLLYPNYRSGLNSDLPHLIETVFAGSNDGMLHAFKSSDRQNAVRDPSDGVERFAYVPNSVFNVPRSLGGATEQKLRMLADPAYQHRYLVDGPPQVSDVFVGPDDASGRWRTVLNESTGAGARSIFVMDVTNPVVGATGGFGPSNVWWEFSEANNVDMGHVLSYGHVAYMANNKWALILGNGYDSSRRQAKLFILDLYTGAVMKEIAVGAAGNNGLSQPNFTLHHRVAQYIYAGDLQGNLWKFDVTSSDPDNWGPSFGSAPNYAPLYTTPANQPITVMPAIVPELPVNIAHPNGGVMINFGTGKMFETEDTSSNASVNVNLTRQAIYGIWDKPSETTGFSGLNLLQEQTDNAAFSQGSAADNALSGTTNNAVDWATKRGWYYRLRSGGERVNISPQIPEYVPSQQTKVFMVANTPSPAIPCQTGGSARVFALNAITGGSSPTSPTFDANRSGTITTADAGYNVWSLSSGIQSQPLFQSSGGAAVPGPTPPAPGPSCSDGRTGALAGGVEPDDCPNTAEKCRKIVTTSALDSESRPLSLCPPTSGRISWRQLK
jgi:type IV pilus assembly protein PilY1